jgi:hypothetical protein
MATAPNPGALSINPREQALLIPLLRDLIQALGSNPSAARYQLLLADVENGSVTAEHFGELENLLEMGLHTGRFRARFGAIGEEALIRLFHQTPRGSAVAGTVQDVNQALTALIGQSIEQLNLAAHGPDAYTFTIETDRCRVTLRIEPTGVRIGDVELAI